eukprot:TRINITY_DN8326_c0_g1_i1.p1 TRINITY_DN8326_c0_g1~~TRINITY_DN8326_c0_g1_i1.p1  ORF type:complete len:143 (-),score=26.15 TRINITY_DN8326_c0_g1_i1:216-644(-)
MKTIVIISVLFALSFAISVPEVKVSDPAGGGYLVSGTLYDPDNNKTSETWYISAPDSLSGGSCNPDVNPKTNPFGDPVSRCSLAVKFVYTNQERSFCDACFDSYSTGDTFFLDVVLHTALLIISIMAGHTLTVSVILVWVKI